MAIHFDGATSLNNTVTQLFSGTGAWSVGAWVRYTDTTTSSPSPFSTTKNQNEYIDTQCSGTSRIDQYFYFNQKHNSVNGNITDSSIGNTYFWMGLSRVTASDTNITCYVTKENTTSTGVQSIVVPFSYDINVTEWLLGSADNSGGVALVGDVTQFFTWVGQGITASDVANISTGILPDALGYGTPTNYYKLSSASDLTDYGTGSNNLVITAGTPTTAAEPSVLAPSTTTLTSAYVLDFSNRVAAQVPRNFSIENKSSILSSNQLPYDWHTVATTVTGTRKFSLSFEHKEALSNVLELYNQSSTNSTNNILLSATRREALSNVLELYNQSSTNSTNNIPVSNNITSSASKNLLSNNSLTLNEYKSLLYDSAGITSTLDTFPVNYNNQILKSISPSLFQSALTNNVSVFPLQYNGVNLTQAIKDIPFDVKTNINVLKQLDIQNILSLADYNSLAVANTQALNTPKLFGVSKNNLLNSLNTIPYDYGGINKITSFNLIPIEYQTIKNTLQTLNVTSQRNTFFDYNLPFSHNLQVIKDKTLHSDNKTVQAIDELFQYQIATNISKFENLSIDSRLSVLSSKNLPIDYIVVNKFQSFNTLPLSWQSVLKSDKNLNTQTLNNFNSNNQFYFDALASLLVNAPIFFDYRKENKLQAFRSLPFGWQVGYTSKSNFQLQTQANVSNNLIFDFQTSFNFKDQFFISYSYKSSSYFDLFSSKNMSVEWLQDRVFKQFFLLDYILYKKLIWCLDSRSTHFGLSNRRNIWETRQ